MPSPLAETNSQSLNELFHRDPLDLSDDDVDALVKKLREHRAAFAKEEQESTDQGRRRKKVSKDKAQVSDAEILDSLDLDL